MTLSFYCPDCGIDQDHRIDGAEAVCTECGSVREVDADQIAAVVDVERCPRCRVTHPVGGECVTDSTPCLRKTGLWPCGTCACCLEAQRADLAVREEAGAVGSTTQTEALYGSPSDIDHPA